MKYLCLFLLLYSGLTVAQNDTITVYFDIDRSVASAEELKKLKVSPDWEKIDIISYTDYLGSVEHNDKLSLERSREIRSRLVQRGLDTELLGKVEGRGITGETLDSKEGILENRRTDIVIYTSSQNELVHPVNTSGIEQENLSASISELEVGDTLALKKLSFLGGRHILNPKSQPYLDSLFSVLRNNPKLQVAIEGHICCTVNDADGLDWETQTYTLSIERAKYVYEYLVERGIEPDRLSYKGFARERPIYPDELTEEEKQANRRVEIRIVEK